MSRPFSVEACDFSGWATRNDLKCSDGRVIRRDAFKNNDGIKVPLVWNHQHNSPRDVLGHAWLENREEGVYTYGFLNDTADGELRRSSLSTVTSVLCPFTPISFSRLDLMCCMAVFAR